MEILSLSCLALLVLTWYFIKLRKADLAKRTAELDERQAALDERQAALDEREAKQDARQAKLLAIKASNKEFCRKEKANLQETHDRERAYYNEKRAKLNERKANLDYYYEQLVMKFNKMQAVVRAFKKVLDTFTCGITQDVFQDPVMLTNGQTYSRAAIDEWFRENETCPNTRQNIWKRHYPNYAMKASIDAFKEAWPAIRDFREAIQRPNKPPAAEAGAAEAGAAEPAADRQKQTPLKKTGGSLPDTA